MKLKINLIVFSSLLVLSIICRGQVSTIQPRIVGGSNSVEGKWPWMGMLVNKQSQNLSTGIVCGASLIHPRWVITAAHCLIGETTASIDVVVGVNRLDDSNFVRVSVAEIIVHPNYSTATFDSDIALLLLETPVDFETLSLIDDDSLESPGSQSTIIGWGATDSPGTVFPIDLQEAVVPIVSMAVANGINSWNGSLTNNMLPAGFASGGVDACVGDSGGPLIVMDQINNRPYLVGVTSFGDTTGCAASNIYGIYTRVNNFRSWIMNIVSSKYLAWEGLNNVKGRFRDPDGDGVLNFIEYAFGSNPLSAIITNRPEIQKSTGMADVELELTYFRRRNFNDLVYNVEKSNNLSLWNKISADPNSLPADPIDSEVERVTFDTNILLNSASSEFIRLNVEVSNNIEHMPRQLTYPINLGSGLSSLSDTDSERANGNYYLQEYLITDLPNGKNISIGFSSPDFTGLVRVKNNDSNITLIEKLGVLNNDQIDIELTAQSSINYLVQVTTLNQNNTGKYNLFIQRSINFPINISEILTNREIDQIFTTAAETYYKTDFLIKGLSVGNTVSVSLATNQFDAFLQVFNIVTKGEISRDDDSGEGFNALLNFVVGADIDYLIRVSTASPEETGSFTLTVF